MSQAFNNTDSDSLYLDHSRNWRNNLYVYPVISRRSGGLSIGVNLNPNKACNFDCVYCQVDRTVPPRVRKVNINRLREELNQTLQMAVDGRLFENAPLNKTPDDLRKIRDIAFSGDGEPTASPQFHAAVEIAAELRRSMGLEDVKLILITDAAYLSKPGVRKTLALMDANNGEIWAKLDAGTEKYFLTINRPNVAFQTVLDNIREAARVRPLVIQSLWMNLNGSPPPETEIDAFAHRLKEIITNSGKIKLVQVYTIARQAREPYVSPLSLDALHTIAQRIKAIIDLPISTFG